MLCLATEIKAWIDDLGEQKKIMNDIAMQAELLSNVLEPLKNRLTAGPTTEPTAEPLKKLILPSILALGKILRKVSEHLEVWKPRGQARRRHVIIAFLAPGHVISIFEDHKKQISEGIQILHLALSTSQELRFESLASNFHQMNVSGDKDMDRAKVPASVETNENVGGKPTQWIQNPEVADFWKTHIGDDVINPLLVLRTC